MLFMSQHSRLNKILSTVRRESIESIRDGSLTITPKLRRRRSAGSKQLYTHTGGSKSFARQMEEVSEQQGRRVSRGKLWITSAQKKDGFYINDDARAIGERIEEIEKQNESSRVLSQNDSIVKIFRKEKPVEYVMWVLDQLLVNFSV
ncbi:uncharacterized protein [Arachis hypogaea]|uniref:uncharacterized protein n=1 Tax=Arachis hypogaea TaxID=3818 RepID=UPI003B211CB9